MQSGFFEEINSERFRKCSKSTAVLGENRYIDFLESLHTLIAGSSKEENDMLLRCILLSISLKNTIEDAEIVLIDPNYEILRKYEDLPLVQRPMAFFDEDIKKVLQELHDEEKRRCRLMAAKGNRIWNGKKIYLIISQVCFLNFDKELRVLLMHVLSLGRSSGVYGIMTSSEIDKKAIPSVIRSLIMSVISLPLNNEHESKLLFDKSGAERLEDGCALSQFTWEEEPSVFNYYKISDKQLMDMKKHITASRKYS